MRAYVTLTLLASISVSLGLCACGASPAQPETPASEAASTAGDGADMPAADKDKPADKSDKAGADKSSDKPSDDAASDKPKKDAAPEPAFTDNMSVEEAIKIAQGTERMNIDQEELSKPLTDTSLYEPCKPGTAHFKLKVAIWRGKAVGIDLTTTPKNPKLTDCLKERIRGVTWSAKVPSLNTVSFTY